jgi:mannose-6-phosphate isomerase-like protein (cupin superfamily)
MLNGRLVKRKWGWYLTLLDYKTFKVKLLRFRSGGALSMQYHRLRNELWLFLSGTHKGCAWHINKGEVHTYYATRATYVLEIQYGEACIEEDIVRI